MKQMSGNSNKSEFGMSLQTIADLTTKGKLVTPIRPEGISVEDAGKILAWKRKMEQRSEPSQTIEAGR